MRSSVKVLTVIGLMAGNGALAEQVSPPPVYAPPPIMPPAPLPPKAVGKSRPASPAQNPGSWVTSADYPAASLRAENQGVTGFELKIDPQGRPSECLVTSSSGWPELDSTTCSLLIKRARFVPALDKKGKPVGSIYRSRFRWVIPSYSGPSQLTPGSRIISFVVEPDGSATNCQGMIDGVAQTGPAATGPCDGKTRFQPIKDADGNPVRKKVTVSMKLEVSDAPD